MMAHPVDVQRMALRLIQLLADKDHGNHQMFELAVDGNRETCNLASVDQNFDVVYGLMKEWNKYHSPELHDLRDICKEADKYTRYALTGSQDNTMRSEKMCNDEGDKWYMIWTYCIRQYERSQQSSRSAKLQRIKFLLSQLEADMPPDSSQF